MRLSIEFTLAWQQLDDWTRERWRIVCVVAVRRLEETPAEVRRRWARTGTWLPNAVLLQQVATQIRGALVAHRPPRPRRRVPARLGQRPARAAPQHQRDPRRALSSQRNAPHSTAFDVDLRALTADWLHGREVGEIGEAYLGTVTDETYRYEQLSEFIAQVLAHLLPWLLSTVVD